MKRLESFFCLFLFFCAMATAQELSVKEFREATNDLSARTKPRQDNNGNDCALIKVQLAAPSTTFTGNVMGNVVFKNNEYWVYMTAGSKRLKVTQSSYLPLEVSFADYGISQLAGKSTYILTLLLGDLPQGLQQPKVQTGWIILDSEPSGASVYINDEFVGNTPLNNYKQPYGKYSYRFEHANYHSSNGVIDLSSGRYEDKIIMNPAFGSVAVQSNVAGAEVSLDGKETGKKTPCTLVEVASGKHTIALRLNKYAPRQEEVTVEDGQTANLSFSLDARFASVKINSLQSAQIYCNGKLMGTGSCSEEMMEGYYDLEARLDHHKSVTKQIQVVAGQAQDIILNPIPKYGSLDIISTPHDANITIDGKLYGKTPFTVEQLLEGEHTVVLSKDGYSSFQKVINVLEGNTETLSATMQEGCQMHVDESKSSITVSGRMTENDWKKLRMSCETKNIKTVDLSSAECNIIPFKVFSECKDLTSIVIPEGVISIDSFAFDDCSGLTSITIPNSVTSIGSFAFSGCSGLTSITIGNSVKSIDENAFNRCSGLTSVTIPNSVMRIGYEAFRNCSSLTSIAFPNSVTSIGESAFHGTAWFESQPSGIVYAGRIAYSIKGGIPNGTSITLKDGTVGIANGAFRSCTGLTSITIPNSVTFIGYCAFSGCPSLTSVTIPNSVTYIGDCAFSKCRSLTSVTIPNSVTYIGDSAFSGCEGLTSIDIPEGVTSIGVNSFRDCSSLTDISIPNSVTSIGGYAFRGTAWLESQPSGIVYAGRVAYSFKGDTTNGTSITLKDGTVGIAEMAFHHCTDLTSIIIPNSVTFIDDMAFSECRSLTSVTIPNSVTYIGNSAFDGCSSLTSISIPNSVTSIGEFAFRGTAWLESQPSGIVYAGRVAYRIKGGIPNGTSITLRDGTVGIAAGAFESINRLTSITIPNSVTFIGDGAFVGSGLTTVTIPNSVTYIGNSAFRGMTIYIPLETFDRFDIEKIDAKNVVVMK